MSGRFPTFEPNHPSSQMLLLPKPALSLEEVTFLKERGFTEDELATYARSMQPQGESDEYPVLQSARITLLMTLLVVLRRKKK